MADLLRIERDADLDFTQEELNVVPMPDENSDSSKPIEYLVSHGQAQQKLCDTICNLIVRRHHPLQAGVTAATCHARYGDELKQSALGITALMHYPSDDGILVLQYPTLRGHPSNCKSSTLSE